MTFRRRCEKNVIFIKTLVTAWTNVGRLSNIEPPNPPARGFETANKCAGAKCSRSRTGVLRTCSLFFGCARTKHVRRAETDSNPSARVTSPNNPLCMVVYGLFSVCTVHGPRIRSIRRANDFDGFGFLDSSLEPVPSKSYDFESLPITNGTKTYKINEYFKTRIIYVILQWLYECIMTIAGRFKLQTRCTHACTYGWDFISRKIYSRL